METRGSFQFAYFDAIKKISNNNNVIKNSMSKQNTHFSRVLRNGHWCGGWRKLLIEFMVIVVLGTFSFYCRERISTARVPSIQRERPEQQFFLAHRARVTPLRVPEMIQKTKMNHEKMSTREGVPRESVVVLRLCSSTKNAQYFCNGISTK